MYMDDAALPWPGGPGFIRMGKEESRTFRGFVREKLDFCEVFNIFHLPFIMITITVKKGAGFSLGNHKRCGEESRRVHRRCVAGL